MPVRHTIDSVSFNTEAYGALHFRLERPVSPGEGGGDLLPIAGWAWGRHTAVVGISVLEHGAPVTTGSVGTPRPDVPQAFPAESIGEACGFNALVALLGVRATFTLQLVAEMANGHRVRFAEIAGRRFAAHVESNQSETPLHRDDEPLIPILVTSLGRTGTSWLMHILSCHAEVVACNRWPHELRASMFWLRTFRAIVEHPHGFDAPQRFESRTGESWWEGCDPFALTGVTPWFGRDYVELAGQSARQAISSFYRALARTQGQPEARYFAEKALPNSAANQVHELFPDTREIILVRDFRGMFCSILAFNRKRGFQGFGRELVPTDEAYVEILRPAVESLHDAARTRPGSLVVRYEDLITDPHSTVKRLCGYLPVADDRPAIADLLDRASRTTPGMAEHQTSRSGADSLARWQTDLTPSMIRSCNDVFGDALAAFGYL